MNKLSIHEIREKYLAFFAAKNHAILPSASLVPENDPTTLFTGSGMQPMLPYLLGQAHPQGQRLADSQKSFRAEDIEEVGDNRHTTFFEMLGNWSLGDYFKEEQLSWMWTFLTEVVGLDPSRIYVSVFKGQPKYGIPKDEVSAQIWQSLFSAKNIAAEIIDNPEKEGLQAGRIFYYDDHKNWWSRAGTPDKMPIGEPGGPDSEMFWDFGAARELHEKSLWRKQPCHINCDCGRFLEIGNNVFMEYIKTDEGFAVLPQKNVDFGGGLERITAAILDDPDIFNIDLFTPLKTIVEELADKKYGSNHAETPAFRVIMDHVRAATFLIGDNVLPGNKDQSYVVRRLLRRAIRFGQQLGISNNFCNKLSQEVIYAYQEPYPELFLQSEQINEAINKEETKFRQTLAAGLKIFTQIADQHQTGAILPTEEIFTLYQSYGFPLEITEELARERGLKVDAAGLKTAFEHHQQLSRAGSEHKFKGGLGGDTPIHRQYHTATHLLHQALRTTLGNHVEQRGSNITAERLRFDFSQPTKLTPEQRQQVEDIVNEQIKADLTVTRQEMTVPEAKAAGALGLFEHKYGELVSVYSIGNFSREICGGPHVDRTSELGHFRITKEEAASAGIRRIKAVLS